MAQSVLSEGPILIRLDHLPPAVVMLLQQGLPDGHTLDLSGYITDVELAAAVAGLASDEDVAAVREALAAAYVKPAGGIPAGDLAAGVVPMVPTMAAIAADPALKGAYVPADGSRPMTGSLALASSFAGGEDDGAAGHFDSTSRLDLYSYQRANVGGYGESIRHHIMRADAKTMEATYVYVDPATHLAAYDPITREPLPGAKLMPVTWQGTHLEANDHQSVHGHWELEIADETGALQGRLEIPYVDQSKAANGVNTARVGIAWTNIRTNLADLSVRAQNITAGDYAGQNTALRVGGNNAVNKDVLLSISSDMQNTGRRWALRANTTTETGSAAGTDFQLMRFGDDGSVLGTALGIERSTGNVLIGATPPGAAGRLHIVPVAGKAAVTVVAAGTLSGGAAYDATMSATQEIVDQSRVTGDTAARFRRYSDGKAEWGPGTAPRDVNLYRERAAVLKTDTAFKVGAYTTATRPSASTLGAGANIFDTTLNRPVWSNGTAWVDAMGTTV